MLFDADDRLVVCNAAPPEIFFRPSPRRSRPAPKFEDLMPRDGRHGCRSGSAGQSADEWIAARIDRHRNPNGAFDDKTGRRPLGAGQRKPRRRSAAWSSVYTDITDAETARDQGVWRASSTTRTSTKSASPCRRRKDVNRLARNDPCSKPRKSPMPTVARSTSTTSEEPGEWTSEKRGSTDVAGGDRRSGYDRRAHLDVGQTTVRRISGRRYPPPKRSDRRSGRRSAPAARHPRSSRSCGPIPSNIAMGGTTGKDIPFPPLAHLRRRLGRGQLRECRHCWSR